MSSHKRLASETPEQYSERRQRELEQRRTDGTCLSCPSPAESGGARCAPCRIKYNRVYLRDYRIRRGMAVGVRRCSNCKQPGHYAPTCGEGDT